MKPAKDLNYPYSIIAKICLCWVILFLPKLASAQVDREFWFAAPYVYDAGREFDKPIVVRISSLSSAATVTISLPADPTFTPITQTVNPNSTISVDLTPWINQLENIPANTVLNKGLLITSTADITAYYEVVSSYCNCNPELFSLKGKNALGTDFFISSQYSYDESTAYTGAKNSFDIVASKDNTHITITPTQAIVGHTANVPFNIVLNAGQTYSATASSSLAGGHLQGSYVSSDNPIAITLKDDLVQVSSCADLIGDQTVPTNVLGTEYIVARGYLVPADNIYVMAVSDGTSVYIDGNATPIAVLAKGQSTTLNLSNPSTYIRADKNVYVYHVTGNGCEVGSAIIPKLNCTGSQSVSIVRSNSDLFAVLITTKNGNQGNFSVNGNNTLVTAGAFSPVPGTGGVYVTAKVDLSSFANVGGSLNFTNSTGLFSLGFINGGTDDGALYGYFSNFKSSSVQTSSVQMCAGGSAQLTAFGGALYQWSPAKGLSNPNIASPVASPAATTDYSVVITSADGCVDSAKVHVKVLTVKNTDTTVAICAGGSYQLPSGRVVSTAGTYNDVVSYKSGCDSIATTLHLIVNGAAPSVTIAASANNVCTGTLIIFTASPADAGTSPTYQWQVNGINAGVNSTTFNSNILANGDKVTCQMTSNSACATLTSVASNSIIIVVNATQPATVSIAGSQNNICVGTVVNFTATPVNGGSAPVYQWQVNGINQGTNSATFSSGTLTNGDKVTCTITSNAKCTAPSLATSNIITMMVNAYSTPSVSIVASTNNICPGDLITFTATAVNGGIMPTYQWLVNGNNAGSNSATFASSTLANGDVVDCVLTSNAACTISPSAASNNIIINVNSAVVPAVTITTSVNNVCAGTPVTFTAVPTNGGSAPFYQWMVNGNNAGTNSNTFVTNTLSNNDIVTCLLTSDAHCALPRSVTSNSVTMNLMANQPVSVSIVVSQNNICAGTSVSFTATAVNGGNNPSYQWEVNGVNSGSNSAIFNSNTLGNGDNVTCTITGNATCSVPNTAISNVINMLVNAYSTPMVTIAASTNNVCPGDMITFTATPVNAGNAPSYQWQVNGVNAGADNALFATNTLVTGDIVSCIVTGNAACSTSAAATSNNIVVNVNAPVNPSLSISASANNVCSGTPIMFTATPTNGGSAPFYQWLVNGNNSGANSNVFVSSTLADYEVVSCVLTSNARCAAPAKVTSNSIIMMINPLPVVGGGGDKIIKQGSSVILNATATGNIGDITWSPDDGLNNPKILKPTASPTKTAIYILTVQSADGCVGTATVKVTVQEDINIPNTFTPNGDGINDKWDIKNLVDYPGCYVKIFDRWGSEVFESRGYGNPWDGTRNGKRLPFGTYYYVITLTPNATPLSGFVAIVR